MPEGLRKSPLKLRVAATIALLTLSGCRHDQGYKIVSFSEDSAVSSDPTLGDKFILVHNGNRIITHCWNSEGEIASTSCPMLKEKVGETLSLDYLKIGDRQFDALVYHPNNSSDSEMLKIASAN